MPWDPNDPAVGEKLDNLARAIRNCDRCGDDVAQFCQGCVDTERRREREREEIDAAIVRSACDNLAIKLSAAEQRIELLEAAIVRAREAWSDSSCQECDFDVNALYALDDIQIPGPRG